MVNQMIEEFLKISHYLGSRMDYVQGAGGNTSTKTPNGDMYVKSSGSRLCEVSSNSGYAILNYDHIAEYVKSPHLSEEEFIKNVNSSNKLPESRPSMETGFHALLGKCVLHSHSVYCNVLNCCENGSRIISDLLPQAAFIGYTAPGRDLVIQVSKYTDCDVLFLKNHGVIVSADSADAAIKLHEEINAKLIRALDLDNFETFQISPELNYSFQHDILFPDQAIYCSKGDSVSISILNEVKRAFYYINAQIKKCGLEPKFLDDDQIMQILSLGAEKFRLRMI